MFIHITYSSSFAIDYSGNIFSRVANYLFLSIKMHKQIGTEGKPRELARVANAVPAFTFFLRFQLCNSELTAAPESAFLLRKAKPVF